MHWYLIWFQPWHGLQSSEQILIFSLIGVFFFFLVNIHPFYSAKFICNFNTKTPLTSEINTVKCTVFATRWNLTPKLFKVANDTVWISWNRKIDLHLERLATGSVAGSAGCQYVQITFPCTGYFFSSFNLWTTKVQTQSYISYKQMKIVDKELSIIYLHANCLSLFYSISYLLLYKPRSYGGWPISFYSWNEPTENLLNSIVWLDTSIYGTFALFVMVLPLAFLDLAWGQRS